MLNRKNLNKKYHFYFSNFYKSLQSKNFLIFYLLNKDMENQHIQKELEAVVKLYYKPGGKAFNRCVAFKLKRILYIFNQLWDCGYYCEDEDDGNDFPQQDVLNAFQRRFIKEIPKWVREDKRNAWIISTDDMFDLYLYWIDK